jgi:hypothetical protein
LVGAVIVCVPTARFEDREPDLGQRAGSACGLARVLQPGQVVVLWWCPRWHIILGPAGFGSLYGAMLSGQMASPPLREAETILGHQDRLALARQAQKFRFADGPSFAMAVFAWGTLMTRA